MTDRLQLLVRDLPPEAQREVLDFIEFLHAKYACRPAQAFRFDWEGALAHLREECDSVQLQHETLHLWGQ